MAKIYPKQIPLEVEKDPKRKAERILFNCFKELLDDQITIYYSRNWRDFQINKKNKNSYFVNGEADFVIVWPDYGILVVECKGGGIEIKEGNFFSTDRNFQKIKIKDPYKQAYNSRYRIIEHILYKKLLRRDKFELSQSILDGVFFPQSSRSNWGKFDIDQKIQKTGFEDDLNNISVWIKSIFKSSLSEKGLRSFSINDCEIIHQIFEPEGACEFAFNTELKESENFFAKGIAPSLLQSKIISQLRYSSRCLIYGSAGTGKTLIGIDALNRFSDGERESVYICNSQILADNLKNKYKNISKKIEFYSYLEFNQKLIRILKSHEVPIDLSSDSETALIDLVVKKTTYRCKTLVLDELQDFPVNIIPALARLSLKNGKFIGLFDPEQNISYSSFSVEELKNLFEFGNYYVLEDNVRNTPQIISFYQNICPSINIVNPLSPNGPENEVFELERIDIKKLENCINKIIKKYGLKANEIIVIVKNQKELSELRLLSAKTTNLASKISFDFNDLNKVRVIDIQGVKGLESKAVLIWSDYKSFNETEKYIAMSRARSLLAFLELNS